MKDQKLREELGAVTSHVLEQMAFMFPEPADLLDGMILGDFELIIVDVSFGGEREGMTSLVVPMEFCRELSENMLGEEVDEANSEEACFDAAKEIVNIITGQLLTRLYGSTAVFDLAPPEIRPICRDQLFKAVDQRDYVCSVVDDYPVIAIFSHSKVADEHQSLSC
jgi:CheY-specific phosphatase CheX